MKTSIKNDIMDCENLKYFKQHTQKPITDSVLIKSSSEVGCNNKNRFLLCIKDVPPIFDEICLKRFMCNYGTVISVKRSHHCEYYFAECATENDFKAVLKGMENNVYKIRVEPKTEKRNYQYNNEIKSNPLDNRKIDMSKRDSGLKIEINSDQDTENSIIDSYMATTYNDKNFNSYKNGPGAALTDDAGNQNVLLLCVKNVPSNLDEISLKRIMSNYGNVISVTRSQHCKYYFAECTTENDFEAILKGMQNNVFGMEVGPKTMKQNQNNNNYDDNNEEIKSTLSDDRQLDMSKRSIKGPFTNRQHPTLGNENRNIDNNDKEYSFNNKNMECNKPEFNKNTEIESRMDIIKKKVELSEGLYNSKEGNFIKFCDQFSLAQLKLKPCNTCQNISIKICEKCNEFYCSIECLYRKTHQCLKLSILDKHVLQSQNKPIKGEIPKSGQTVIITHFEQINMVYIRSCDKTENDDYIKIINDVARISENAKFLTKLPNVNEYVVATYNGIWHRAIVLNNENPEKIHIAYIDIGNNEKKKLSELKKFLPQCYKFKRYPFVIYLKNLENSCPNDYFTNYINKIINSDTELKIIYKENELKNNKIVAELYNLETNDNINNKCLELLTPTIPKDTDDPIMLEHIYTENIPTGENISIIIVSHTFIQLGIISCISSYEVQELDDFNVELKKYAESTNHHYTPRPNEMCIAKSDNTAWYRGCCNETVGDGYPNICFIDYGNMSPVSIKNVRKYPKAFTLPIKTDYCTIYGLNSENNEEIGERLRALLPLYSKITVPKIEYVNEETILHLPHIIDTLIHEGLLQA